jgi:hypothetical protein
MIKVIRKIPKANALLFGLRSIGYSFSTAVADIIDNSIAAHSKNVFIFSDPLCKKPFFEILDDGNGMSFEDLDNAMAFGSNTIHDGKDELDLGRFGLGLNTASLSQCKKFTVITKKDNVLSGAFWDIDIVEKENDWNLQVIGEEEISKIPNIEILKNNKSGTIVLWEKFDKISETSDRFEVSFRDRVSESKKHCELVFHRFYGELKIFFNSLRIEKRDPFLEDVSQKSIVNQVRFNSIIIPVIAFVLPYSSSLTDEQKQLIGGVKTLQTEQGFYLYRNKRLIFWGTWLRMNSKNELNKLARIRVDIPSTLDSVWMLDVKKSAASIPDSLRNQIWASVNDAEIKSKKAIRYPGEKEFAGNKEKIWSRTKKREGEFKYEINHNAPLIDYFSKKLETLDSHLFNELINQIETFLPKSMLNADISDDTIRIINGEDCSSKNNDNLVDQLAEILAAIDVSRREEFCDTYLTFECYIDIANQKDEIIRRAKIYGTK